jgi:hypothetical protein
MFHSAHHFTLENPTLIDQHIYSGGDENRESLSQIQQLASEC